MRIMPCTYLFSADMFPENLAQHFVLAPLVYEPEWDGYFRESQVYPVSRYQMPQQRSYPYQ